MEHIGLTSGLYGTVGRELIPVGGVVPVGDDSAIQWCQFCVSLSGNLFNILQLFASFSQNP